MSRMMIAFAAALAFLPACGAEAEQPPAGGAASAPSETRPPNSKLKPAVAGQTRAPTVRADVAFDVQEFATGLDMPWALEFLPDGRLLVTERSGSLRFVDTAGKLSDPGQGLPPVVYESQGGLLDVALDPEFAANRTIYWTYSEPRDGGSGTALAKGQLSSGARPDVSNVQVIFRMMPTYASSAHFGGRIAFASDGKLFLTLGERSDAESRVRAQDLGAHFGKVVRINRDGSVPQDNPFVGTAGALPEIWSYGHRNPQGIAFRPGTDQLWEVEHGPRGGDELNLVAEGANYGWPVITYGIEYGGDTIGEGIAVREGMTQPVYYWDPVIAPSGLLFYSGKMFPAWKGNAFIGGLGSSKLVRLTLEGDRVTGEEWLVADREERYRDVREAPDGAIWLVAEEGKLLRIAARR
jgi:aldose sugar dehydrogenase